MILNNSISFIIPCYNEEKKILDTFYTVLNSVNKSNLQNYEIIFIDDCSKDKTFKNLQSIKEKYKNIIIIKNDVNIGFGGSFFIGLKNSHCDFCMLLPGDNAHNEYDIKLMINSVEDNDFVITYYTNPKDRNFSRYLFTKLYTPFLNFLFKTKIPYFNGINIYNVNTLKMFDIKNQSFSFQIEIILNFLKLNKKYTIVPTSLNEDRGKKTLSKAFSIRNVYLVIKEITRLIFKFRIIKS